MGEVIWDPRKNEWLKKDRGVSFEDVVAALRTGDLLGFVEHHNQVLHAGQLILIVKLGEYAYLVPAKFEGDDVIFKTIVASRKATRDFLKGGRRRGKA